MIFSETTHFNCWGIYSVALKLYSIVPILSCVKTICIIQFDYTWFHLCHWHWQTLWIFTKQKWYIRNLIVFQLVVLTLFLLGQLCISEHLTRPSIWQIPYYLLVTGMLSTRLYKSCSSLCLITASKLLSKFCLRCWTSSRMRSASAKWRVEFVDKKPEKKVWES